MNFVDNIGGISKVIDTVQAALQVDIVKVIYAKKVSIFCLLLIELLHVIVLLKVFFFAFFKWIVGVGTCQFSVLKFFGLLVNSDIDVLLVVHRIKVNRVKACIHYV